ncbi:MAG TPA: ADP-ribosylglycohydrolase family protein [Streptosporangiaceae bacterium]
MTDQPASAERIAGALLGVHAGDALGATLEFRSWQAVRAEYPGGLCEIVGGGPFDWPPGHATDDTDLTRAVLLAYLDAGAARLAAPGPGAPDSAGCDSAFDVVRAAADYMLAWLDGDWPGREPGSWPRDIGGATSQGLERYRRGQDPRASGAGQGQAGNGSLMRCIPTALAVTDRQRRLRESAELSAITHDDDRATAACAAYNEIVAALLTGASPAAAVTAGLVTAAELGSQPVADAVAVGQRLQPAAMAATGEIPLHGKAAGYVLESLSLAVAAVLDPRPLPDVLIDIVRLGNDTDTNAAIAGGLLGARDGANAIPARWTAVLQFAAEFAAAAQVLASRW